MTKRTPWDHGKTTTERGLGWAWQKQRLRVLSRDLYLCQDCLSHGLVTEAREVHHIIPRAKAGPGLAKDDDCVSLCKECHAKRDADEQGRRPPLNFDPSGRVVW